MNDTDHEHSPDLTAPDLVYCALAFALKHGAISQSEHDSARTWAKASEAAIDTCDLAIRWQAGPTNSNPFIAAKKVMAMINS